MYYVLLHVITKHHRVLTPSSRIRPVLFVVAGNIISFMTYLAPL
jgi:hypothetical protein